MVFDIIMLFGFSNGGHPHRVALIAFRQSGDCFGHSCRKHKGAAIIGGFAQNKFKILAKSQIQHFIGFV